MIVGFETSDSAAARIIEVNADKDRILLCIFDRDAFLERNENVAGARHHNLEIGLAEFARKSFCHVERSDFFRAAKVSVSTVVLTAMAGIDYDSSKRFARVLGRDLSRLPRYGARGKQAGSNDENESRGALNH